MSKEQPERQSAAVLVDRLERLAALRLDAEERRLLRGDLDKIMALIDAMQSVDVAGVAPLHHPLEGVQPLRPDAVTEDVRRDELQRSAPATADGLYLVPRVVE
jgi:aspartyl-tRNA(Asn)/glutamyl-tRNA(Gln) amidotransferase subunit C